MNIEFDRCKEARNNHEEVKLSFFLFFDTPSTLNVHQLLVCLPPNQLEVVLDWQLIWWCEPQKLIEFNCNFHRYCTFYGHLRPNFIRYFI